MTVHHVHVNAVGPTGLGLADLLAQPGEIRGQDGRSELDRGTAHGFSSALFLTPAVGPEILPEQGTFPAVEEPSLALLGPSDLLEIVPGHLLGRGGQTLAIDRGGGFL